MAVLEFTIFGGPIPEHSFTEKGPKRLESFLGRFFHLTTDEHGYFSHLITTLYGKIHRTQNFHINIYKKNVLKHTQFSQE